MKKYRLKVDSPWGYRGSIVSQDSDGLVCTPIMHNRRTYASYCNPELYPGIFQEVIEQSDEEIIEQWFIRNFHDISINSQQWNKVAKALIKHGFDIKTLKLEDKP